MKNKGASFIVRPYKQCKPEYKNWWRFNRHRGGSKAKPGKDETKDEVDASEPLLDEVADDSIFWKDEIDREKKASYGCEPYALPS